MTKGARKIVVVLLAMLMILSALGNLFLLISAEASEFEGKETQWDQLCSVWSSYEANKAKCLEYKAYLSDKKKEADAVLNDLKGDIGSITGDINKDNAVLKAIHERIESLDAELKATKERIVQTEQKIAQLEVEIEERTLEIDKLKEQAANYMVTTQSTLRVNGYVEFLLGAKDFAEISRRLEGMGRINERSQQVITDLNEEMLVLEDNKQDMSFQKVNLIGYVEEQEKAIVVQKELQSDVEQKIEKLREKHASLVAAQEKATAEQKAAANRINSIGPIQPSTGSLGLPIASGFRVSASVWAYPNSTKKHVGIDLAAPVGTALLAPASGVVIATFTSCPTWGGYPTHNCSSGFGNYIVMIVNNNGKIYGVLYAHLKQNGAVTRVGQTVSKGQKVAEVGSSGPSTGPHVHAELFYLGNDSVQAAYNRWYNGSRSVTFGTSSAYGNEYQYRCDVKGLNANCRLNPSREWGLYLGNKR